jgi:hypothetical protein
MTNPFDTTLDNQPSSAEVVQLGSSTAAMRTLVRWTGASEQQCSCTLNPCSAGAASGGSSVVR